MGPYRAHPDGSLRYVGNRIIPASNGDIRSAAFPDQALSRRVEDLAVDERWRHLATINDAIFAAAVDYFRLVRAHWVPLPLTTRMISSPGAVYGREAISYTTDTNPVRLTWFDHECYLAESSQIYLELALLTPTVHQVFCIYNSFRKERADATHLSEFHHVEYEGQVDQDANIRAATELLRAIVNRLVEHDDEPLRYFLWDAEIEQTWAALDAPEEITFADALAQLHRDTDDERYARFTLEHFGAWQEVRLTELLGGRLVVLREFPLLEVPFYHRPLPRNGHQVADAADFIWPGYREVLGSGARVASEAQLDEKAAIFQLPRPDYEPYLQTRRHPGYRPTAGFGLGWERLVQGILRLPHIWDTVPFPRGDSTLVP